MMGCGILVQLPLAMTQCRTLSADQRAVQILYRGQRFFIISMVTLGRTGMALPNTEE